MAPNFAIYNFLVFFLIVDMHSESTTDLSILYTSLSRGNANNKNVVLITTGALNPVHRSHISNMIKTKQHLELVYGFNVIGGYLSPSHDRYVQCKLDDEHISGEHRIEMCQKAIQESNQYWLSVDKAECMAPRFVSFPDVTFSLQKFINKTLNLPEPVHVLYVAGLDLFNRCNGLRELRTQKMGGVAVIYRSGQQERSIKTTLSKSASKLYYVKDNDAVNEVEATALNKISSTQIRKMLKNKESCEHLTYPSVLKHLKTLERK